MKIILLLLLILFSCASPKYCHIGNDFNVSKEECEKLNARYENDWRYEYILPHLRRR